MSSKIILGGNTLGPVTTGAIERDAKAFYASMETRMLISAEQIFRLNAGFAGASVNTAQDVFNFDPTVVTSTQYEYELVYGLTKSAGVISHTIATSFAGTATFNNITRHIIAGNVASAASATLLVAPSYHGLIFTETSTVMTGAIAATASNFWIRETGTFSVSAGGTIIPQYTLSVAPGGAYTTVAGSFFKIKPIGDAGADIKVGSWV